jgi:hypothetical protein
MSSARASVLDTNKNAEIYGTMTHIRSIRLFNKLLHSKKTYSTARNKAVNMTLIHYWLFNTSEFSKQQ